MKKCVMSFLMGAACMAAQASPAPSCEYERANYVLRGDPTFTAHFEPAKMDDHNFLVLIIESARTGIQYHIGFDQGNGVGSSAWGSAVSFADGRMVFKPNAMTSEIFQMDQDLNLDSNMPLPGKTAPAYFFMPRLSAALWYDDAYPATDRPADKRESVAYAFFALADCNR